jgi:glutathione S-transferase
MKLFIALEFSSLAAHVSFLEAGIEVEITSVDLETKRLADGSSFLDINPKGQVPALMLDECEVLTENVAILTWIADHAPQLGTSGDCGRYRLLEMLSFIATEIHKRFPIYLSLPEDAQSPIKDDILHAFGLVKPPPSARLPFR